MGLFSGIKKLGKKLFKGVKKVFKKVGKFVGKVMKSKIGKMIMLAASVVTGGLSIAAFAGGFMGQAAGASLLTKFVAGAKAFAGTLLNPVGAAKGAFQGVAQGGGLGGLAQGAAQGQGIFNVGLQAPTVTGPAPTAGAVEGAETAAVNASTGGLDAQVSEHLANVGSTAGQTSSVGAPVQGAAGGGAAQMAQAAEAGAKPGLFGRINNFIESPAGQAAGGLLKGAAKWAEEQDRQKWESRYDRAWEDPRQLRILREAAGDTADIPGGFSRRSRGVNADWRSKRIPLGPAYGG